MAYKNRPQLKGTKFKYNKVGKKVLKGVGKYGLKTSPLAIPPPNPDPQPPNAPPQTPPQTTSYTSTPPDTTTQQQQAAQQTTGQSQPIVSDAFSNYVPDPNKPDPRDSQYWTDVNRLWFDRNQKLDQANTDETYATTAYEQALQQRAMQNPRDILSSNIGANQFGNLTSSVQQENLGQIAQNYYTANTDAERQFQQDEASRKIIREGIAQGYTLDEAAALAQAIDRQSQGELSNPPPTDPNADTYGDTYGTTDTTNSDLADLLQGLLGGGSSGGGSSKSTTARINKATAILKNRKKASKKAIAWARQVQGSSPKSKVTPKPRSSTKSPQTKPQPKKKK